MIVVAVGADILRERPRDVGRLPRHVAGEQPAQPRDVFLHDNLDRPRLAGRRLDRDRPERLAPAGCMDVEEIGHRAGLQPLEGAVHQHRGLQGELGREAGEDGAVGGRRAGLEIDDAEAAVGAALDAVGPAGEGELFRAERDHPLAGHLRMDAGEFGAADALPLQKLDRHALVAGEPLGVEFRVLVLKPAEGFERDA